jgi:hypothetical protein
MSNQLLIREDFRRDGLFVNFLVDSEIMLLIARSFPGSRLQIGYPAICEMEREMCHKIMASLQNEDVEMTLSGHAKKEHLDIMNALAKPYSNATVNIWIPVSNLMISRTLKWSYAQLLAYVLKLITYWKNENTSNHIDVALVDCTEKEAGIEKRIAHLSRKLHNEGVRTTIICDSKGQGEPVQIKRLFETIRKYDEGELEFHPHNDNGKGFDNLQAAMEFGIKAVGTSLFNAGERFSMIDPRDVFSKGYKITYRSQCMENFEKIYRKKVKLSLAELRQFFEDGLTVTGTQYRLFGRNQSTNLLFGVTSDRYILARLLKTSEREIDSVLLELFKNQIYQEKKLFYSSEELGMLYKSYMKEKLNGVSK